MLNRNIAPPIVDAVDFNLQLKPYQKFTLKNGVEVYTVHAGAEEVMAIEWVFRAGNTYEEQNLIAASTNFLLKNGTSSKTAFQINEHFDYYGSYLNRACYNETATLSLHTLTRHINELLPVVRELLTDATMPQEELDIYRQNMKQRLKVNLKKSDFVAGRLIDVYLYGDKHPYGKYSTAEDFDALQQEQIKSFYKKYYQQGKLVIFASGRLPANLEELLNRYFGDLPNGQVPQVDVPAHPAAEKKYRIINDEQGVQGSIRLARPFPNRHHPDFLKAQVLNALFGGFFGSRLMVNIREDKGYTYGIHSYLQNHISQSAWMVSTEAGREVSEAAIKEVYKEMKDLREELVDDEELLLVRNYMMGSILGDLDGPFQIMARWKNIILNELDENYFYNSINAIKTVTAEELQALAQKYLNPEEFYELIVV
ncbi:MAG: insulinase family protein [Sphingobacteriales bacterium]|nr:insulinase family protein [Sphingobacteriales bacterium]OJW01735.1 MAG: peptidase M16 [Sphingobacteriales bacterium 44-61]